MGIQTLNKRSFFDPLLKALQPWPAGLGAGIRGGKVLASKTGNIRYAPRTTLRVPTKGAPQEWQHAIKTVMPKAQGDGLGDAAQIAHDLFPKTQAHEFLRGFHVKHGDYHSKVVRIDGYRSRGMQPDRLSMTGHVFHTPTGKKVGEFHREFEREGDDVTAHHGRFEIDAQHRGSGFGTHFYHSVEQHYKKAGIHKVSLLANIKEGPYVWAMNGYDFDSQKDRDAMTEGYKKFLAKHADGATFRRSHDIPFHSRTHPLHPWEIAAHTVNGRRTGKEFLTGEGDSSNDRHFYGVKKLDSSDEGYRVGLAYQRSHMMRKQNLKANFAKAGPPEEDAPSEHQMDRKDAEGLERHMDRWHDDEHGDEMARQAVERVVDEHHSRGTDRRQTPGTLADRKEGVDSLIGRGVERRDFGKPKTVLETSEPAIKKAELWKEGRQWYANEEWLWKVHAEPFGLIKAAIKPIAPIRSGVGGPIANRPSAPIAPKLSKLANAPKLERPSIPKGAGNTVKAKDVPRTSDGRIDWGSVTPGSSFWVTLHDQGSLEGRAVRITKRQGGGMKGMAISSVSGLHLGKIKSTRKLGGQFNKEERQLGVPADRVRKQPEAADISKMSSEDIRAGAQVHGRMQSKERSPEEEKARASMREKSTSPAASGKRREFRAARSKAKKAAAVVQNALVGFALGHLGNDEEGKPNHLDEKELAKSYKKLGMAIRENPKFKRLNPHTQDVIAGAIRNASTVLDDWQRMEQRLAVEAHARRKLGLKWNDDVPLPVDIGEAGVEVPAGRAISHEDSDAGGRAVVLRPSALDAINEVGKQIDNGVLPEAAGQGQIQNIISDEIEANVDAAKGDETAAPTPEEAQAKADLETAAKDPNAIVVKPGRKRQSVRKYIRDMEDRLLSKKVQNALGQLDIVRAGLGESSERDKASARLFRDAQSSSELGPWLLEADQNIAALHEAVQLIESGNPLPEEKLAAARTIEPKVAAKVFNQLGRHMNSRRMGSAEGAMLLGLKYGGAESFGDLPPLTDIEPPNMDTIDPKDLPNILSDPSKGGSALLQCGPYYQAQALRTFEDIRRTHFPEVESKTMKNFVRTYGMEVSAHMFAQHLYRKFVADIKEKGMEAPEYTGRGASKMKPAGKERRGWEALAKQRELKWDNVIERLYRDANELNPVVERDMARNEADLERLRDGLSSSYDSAVKRGDEGAATKVLLDMQSLTARGAQNAGSHLGAMTGQWELMNAMRNVKGDYRISGRTLNTEYGEDKELAQKIAVKVFKGPGWEKHVQNQGTPENPQWTVTGTLGKWLGQGSNSIAAMAHEDEEREKMRADNTRSEYDETDGEQYAKADSFSDKGDAGTWIGPGGKYVKSGVRLKAGQRNAIEVLHRNPTGILDHTTGFGKTGIGVLSGLNEIGHAEAKGEHHRMLIIHNDDGVWGKDPEMSSWANLVSEDAPVHSVIRGEVRQAVTHLNGMKNKSGIVMINHRDLAKEDVKTAIRDAGFHRVLLDEPQSPGMVLSHKGGYTNTAKFLYSGSNPLIQGEGQNDHTGPHLILSSATLANPDTPKAMYKQLSPLLKRAGSKFGSSRQWGKLTSSVGSLSPAAQSGTIQYLRGMLSNVQTSDPKYRYGFPIKAKEHFAKLTPEQHDAVANWNSTEAQGKVVEELLKAPEKIARDDFEYEGPRTQAEHKRNLDLYDASRGAGKYHGTLSERGASDKQRKRIEWLRLVEQTRRQKQTDSVYGVPRDQLAKLLHGTGSEGYSILKKHAPAWDSFLKELKPGEKTIAFMGGSHYLSGVAQHMFSMRMHQREMHGGKAEHTVKMVKVGVQPGETRKSAEERVNKAIADFNALPDGHSGVLIFDKPLSGKNIGKADHVLIGDPPLDENGHPDVTLVQQSLGRAMRGRGKRTLKTHTLNPAWVPAMDNTMTMKRQLASTAAYNPAVGEAVSPAFPKFGKSLTWLRVGETSRLASVQGARGVFLSKRGAQIGGN